MPITSIGSYLTTANQIVPHWADVDADRAAKSLAALLLPGNYSLANFEAERDALETALIGLEDLENTFQLATGDRDSQKDNIRERLRQFRAAGTLYLAGTAYPQATPTLPHLNTTESRFLKPLDDMASLWARIDAETTIPGFTAPLLLTGGYSLAGFTADLAALRGAYRAVADADNDLNIARKQRDGLLDSIRSQMQKYHMAIELEYGPGHPFVESLPALTPTAGSTPDAVTLNGDWDAVTMEGVLSWDESSDPNLAAYKIRMSPGATYSSANATVVGNISPGTLEHRTTAGLSDSGDVASFKVFVVRTTGNEAGSNTVTITRP